MPEYKDSVVLFFDVGLNVQSFYRKDLAERLKSYVHQTRGSFGQILAVCLPVLLLVAADSINIASAYNQKDEAQDALDEATLAYLSLYVDSYDEAMARSVAENSLHENLQLIGKGAATFSPVEFIDKSIVSHSSYSFKPYFPLPGFSKLTGQVTVKSQTAISLRSPTVLFVPDVSYTMASFGRMSAMREGLKQASAMLYDEDGIYENRFRIGMIPYSASVNLQEAAPNLKAYLKDWSYRPNLNRPETHNLYFRPTRNHEGDILYDDKVIVNDNDVFIQVLKYLRSGGRWVYKGIVDQRRDWTYCMQSRPKDYKSDAVPAHHSVDVFPKILFRSNMSWCPQTANRAQANIGTKAKFDAIVNNLVIDYGTRHDTGMLWAMRHLSPKWSNILNTDASPWNSNDEPKYIVLLSDGKMSKLSVLDAFKAMDKPQDRDWDKNFKNICDFVKSKGVKVIVIAYELEGNPYDDLAKCGSHGYTFSANTANIKETFANIASLIKKETLRISW